MNQVRPSLAAALALPLLFSAVSVAHADLAAEARYHDEAARAHYAARRYDAAAREFMMENRLAPNPNVVLNIAFCFQQMERREEAFMYFSEYLASGEDSADRRAQAEQALQQLRPHVALVRVDSDPQGASIFVDRRELGEYGRTPRLLALPAGDHRIWLEREGYRPAEQNVTLVAGQEVRVSLATPQILGRLHLVATSQAQVRVLHPDQGLVFEGQTPVDAELAPGTYRVDATAEGGDRWSEPVSIRPDATTEIEATLQGPTGDVTIVANQVGALVRVDGRDMGFTPQVLSGIAVGDHQVEVSAEDMQPYAGEVGVAMDQRTWVSVNLSPSAGSIPTDETWALGGVTLGLLAGAGIFTGLAASAFGQFQDAQAMGMAPLDLAGQANSFALTADLLWLGAGATALTTLIMFFVSLEQQSRPSSATVSQEEP